MRRCGTARTLASLAGQGNDQDIRVPGAPGAGRVTSSPILSAVGLPADEVHVVVAVAVAVDADRRRGGVEVGDVIGGQRNAGGAGILREPFAAPGAGDRAEVLVLGQQP